MGTLQDRAALRAASRYRPHLPALAGLAIILIAGFLVYPGRQFLTSDTQIWAVMMEHSFHPEFLGKDLLAQYPHIGLSFYDEIVNGIRSGTGLSLEQVMVAHQVVFRAILLASAYFLALALCGSRLLSLWMAASLEMIYYIAGPTVCVIEVEPVPRAYSLALGVLAVALAANRRKWGAAWALGAAMLFQAVIVYPMLLAMAAWTLFSQDEGRFVRRLRYWVPVAGMAAIVLLLSIAEQGGSGGMFEIVPEWLRGVQRMRASYNWVSLWPRSLVALHAAMAALVLLSYARLRKTMAEPLRWYLWGIPVVALVSMPTAWLLMERLHLMIAAQTQPARALAPLYALGVVMLLSAGAGAARNGRWFECWGWLLGGYAMVFLDRTVALAQALETGRALNWQWGWAPALAFIGVGFIWLLGRRPLTAGVCLGILMVAPFLIYRIDFGVNVMAQDARTPAVMDLSRWAAENTARDALFLFPGFERSTAPGVFRATARRALYVDWKSGGQVNFDIEFARQWWARWNDVGKGKFNPNRAGHYLRLGIDYLVTPRTSALDGLTPLFENADFAVYRTSDVAACIRAATCSVSPARN